MVENSIYESILCGDKSIIMIESDEGIKCLKPSRCWYTSMLSITFFIFRLVGSMYVCTWVGKRYGKPFSERNLVSSLSSTRNSKRGGEYLNFLISWLKRRGSLRVELFDPEIKVKRSSLNIWWEFWKACFPSELSNNADIFRPWYSKSWHIHTACSDTPNLKYDAGRSLGMRYQVDETYFQPWAADLLMRWKK